jgi:CRP-like cAMP-binding protein
MIDGVLPSARSIGRERDIPGLSATALWCVPQLMQEERHALEDSCTGTRRVSAGCEILRNGGEATAIFVLIDGWACRYKLTASGARQICTILVPGDVCNLGALLAERLDCGIAAITRCNLALLSVPTARQLASRFPGIALAFGRLAMIENSILSESLLSLGRLSAHERLAHLLCELFVRLEAAGLVTGEGYDLPLTQELLGDVLGLTSVHVNRMVQQLRSEQLISLHHGYLTILDWDQLANLGGFQRHYLHHAAAKPPAATREDRDGLRSAVPYSAAY